MMPTTAGNGPLPEVALSTVDDPPTHVQDGPAWEADGRPFAVGDLVIGYLATDGGDKQLQAVDGLTGEPRWQLPGRAYAWPIPPRSPNSPVLEHEGGATLYAAGEQEDEYQSVLYGIDVATGEPNFATPLKEGLNWTGVVAATNSAVLVQIDTSHYGGFDPKSGERLWTREFAATPSAVTEDTFLVSDTVGVPRSLTAYDLRTGKEVWSSPSDLPEPLVYAGKDIVVLSRNFPPAGDAPEPNTVVIDANTGNVIRHLDTNFVICAGESSSMLVCEDLDRGLHGLDAETGEPTWTYDAAPHTTGSNAIGPWSPAVGGALYLHTGQMIDLTSGTILAEDLPTVVQVGNGFVVESSGSSSSARFSIYVASS